MKRLHCVVEMADGRVLEADTTTADYIRFEKTARTHGWGSMQDNTVLWEAFAAWSALTRTGQYSDTWEQFIDTDVDLVDSRAMGIPPTKAEAGEDFSQS